MFRNPPFTRLIVPTLAAATLVLASCGGDDDDAADTTVGTVATADTTTDATTSDVTAASGSVAVTTDAAGSTVGTTAGSVDNEDDEYVDAVADALDMGDSGECVARELVTGIGFDDLRAAGVTPDQLAEEGPLALGLSIPEERHGATVEGVAGCGNLVEAFADSGDATDDERACADEHLSDEIVAEVLVGQLANVPPSEELTAAQAAYQECAAP